LPPAGRATQFPYDLGTHSNGRLKLDFYLSAPKAAWPVSPPLEPRQTFASEPLQAIAIPIKAAISDRAAKVIDAVAWPGTRDRYGVDVRIPAVDSPEAMVILLADWILPRAIHGPDPLNKGHAARTLTSCGEESARYGV
jgi:hypothetical protein